MTADLENITKRLEKIEKQNRGLKQTWIAVLLLVCLVVTLGVAAPTRVIEAEKFVLKDASGKTRATLSSGDTGSELRFLDEEGKLRLGVGIYIGAPSVALFDQKENQVATFVADQTGSELWFGGGAVGKPLATLGTSLTLGKDGGPALAPFLRLRDRKGRDRVDLEFSPVFEQASIDVYGASTKENISMSVGDAFGPTLLLGAPGGTATVSSDKDGTFLSLSDSRGYSSSLGSVNLVTSVTGETHRTSAASVVLFDKGKNVIWKAP